MIDTRKVRDRRRLRFETFDAAIGDAEGLADAEQRGTLRTTGNWQLGQAIGHLTYWARAPFDGYPAMPRPPWLLRLLIPLMKDRFLNRGFPVGVRIRGVPAGTFGLDLMPTDRALPELREAYGRIASQAPLVHNPVLGQLTHDDWIKLNLRHAELHLGFFHAD